MKSFPPCAHAFMWSFVCRDVFPASVHLTEGKDINHPGIDEVYYLFIFMVLTIGWKTANILKCDSQSVVRFVWREDVSPGTVGGGL